MADKLRTSQHLDNLIARHLGVGHADTRPQDFAANMHRDSYASYVGHPPILSYMALGMGEPKEMVRMRFLEKMVRPLEGREGEGEQEQQEGQQGRQVNGGSGT